MYVVPVIDGEYQCHMNENFYDHHESIKKINHKINIYPRFDDLHYKLISNISEVYKIPKENILLTAGSSAGLEMICNKFLNSNSTCLVPCPTFGHMLQFIKNKTNHVTYVNVTGEKQKDEESTISIMLTHIFDFMYICQPNMPQGYCFNLSTIVNWIINNPNTLFVIDEAYFEFGPLDLAHLFKYNNVIITRTFSKAFGLGGLRIGYIIYHNVSIFDKLYNMTSVTNLAKQTALLVLEHKDYYDNNIHKIIQNRDYLKTRLKDIIKSNWFVYKFNIQHGCYMILWSQDNEILYNELLKWGITSQNKGPFLKVSLLHPKCINLLVHCILYLNLKDIFKYEPICYDLDGTLINNDFYELTDTFLNSLNLKNTDIIITNSTKNPDITNKNVKTALQIAKDYFFENNIHPAILTSDINVKNYFADIEGTDYLFAVDDFSKIDLSNIKNKSFIYIIDLELYKEKYDYILLGKPFVKLMSDNKYKFMIGNSFQTDYQFSQLNNMYYIHINSNITDYKITNLYIELSKLCNT